MRSAALSLTLALLLAACGGDGKPETATQLHLSGLALVDRGPQGSTLGEAWLESTLKGALKAVGIALEGSAGGWVGQLEGEVNYAEPGAEGQASLRLSVRLKIPGERVPTLLEVEAKEKAGDVKGAVRRACEAAAGRLDGYVKLLRGPRAGLIAGLASADPGARLVAIERVAALQDRAAVPALVERLSAEPTRDLRFRVVGALSEMGDPRAINGLIDATDLKDRVFLRVVVEALATLGGPRVGDFFDLLSSHDDPAIRFMVESARGRMTPVASPR